METYHIYWNQFHIEGLYCSKYFCWQIDGKYTTTSYVLVLQVQVTQLLEDEMISSQSKMEIDIT